MLLDSNSLIYRAYFALMETPLSTSKGQLVNAVFGFWSIVLRGFQDVKPDYVIACFDLAGPTFRHEQFVEYKATRREMPDDLRDQFPVVRQIIEAFGIPIYQLQGYEADDLIAALVRQAEAHDVQTTIVSGDLDLLQLVSERTTLMTTRGGVQQTVYYDPPRVLERYGLQPSQMIDFKALKGDTTDNIPGIPGVGYKMASNLLNKFANVEIILQNIENISKMKFRGSARIQSLVAEHQHLLPTNKKLTTIVTDAVFDNHLDDIRWQGIDEEAFHKLLDQLNAGQQRRQRWLDLSVV